MKKIFFCLSAIFLFSVQAGQAQNLVYEQDYTRNPVTPAVMKIIPLKDGGLFMAYCRSPKASIKSSQVLVEFDKEGKKVFEKNTEVTSEFKNKEMSFVYNPVNGYVYGIYTYTKKGAALADIMLLQRDGAYSAKTGIPTPPHVTNAFMSGSELVLLGLNEESLKQPSGEYEALVIKGDLSASTPKKLTLPAFKNEAGIKKNRLVAADNKTLYFVTENRSATDGKLSYDFIQYDWNTNKVTTTKTVNIDLGENTVRDASLDLAQANPELLVFEDYATHFPNVIYNRAENAFFITGSYGKGFTTYEAGREHAGVFMVRVNTGFTTDWTSLIPAPSQVAGNKIYSAYTSKHQLLLTGKNKNYLVCNAVDQGQYQGTVYSIDLKTGKEKEEPAMSGENTGLILAQTLNHQAVEQIPDLKEKASFKPYFVQNGDKTYLLINHEKKTKVYVYTL